MVVTKDADFLAVYELNGVPKRMVYVGTGNIRNSELIFLFMRFLDPMCEELKEGGFVELDRDGMTVR